MKKTLRAIALFTILFATSAISQIKDTTYWNRNFEVGLNINQAGFNKSWQEAQGGLSYFAISAFLFAKSTYVQNRSKVMNDLQLQYGRIITDGVKDYQGGYTGRKNVDRIFFDNTYTYAITEEFGAFASVNFQSQFDKGHKIIKTQITSNVGTDSIAVQVSSFLAPGALIEGIGVEWTPISYFSARFAPVAFRQRFSVDPTVTANVSNSEGVHLGVEKGAIVNNRFGLNILAKFDKDLATNINLKVMGQYFASYENMAVGTIRFDAIFTAKITKYINVNITGVLLYNHAQIAAIQANEQVALGIVYKMNNEGVE